MEPSTAFACIVAAAVALDPLKSTFHAISPVAAIFPVAAKAVAVVALPANAPVNVCALIVPLAVTSTEYAGLAVPIPSLLFPESQKKALLSELNPLLPSANCMCPAEPEEFGLEVLNLVQPYLSRKL